ncbi:hypothetical protein AVEN_212169-1 [Araneus ventricosus]|uniref:Uncharacterized protein n=1 Tax=Araneus ventricosus TaxID=182803 RepID=A0A4Y2J7X5_ARAVE|nr:hypothetical protein AVEN_212169-1 [Araneus ventricosus]
MMHRSILELTRNLPRFSLQEMSLFRIIASLCNNRHLPGLILKCNFQKDLDFRLCARKGKEWEAVEAMANELVSQICSSVLLKKRILELLWPMSYRIMLWKYIYAPSVSNRFLQQFYWTEQGRIDNTRTAGCIIGNKSISVRNRFVLACSVCLVKEIFEMWIEMSNKEIAYFFTENDEKISPLLFWAHILVGSDIVLRQYTDALKCAVKIGLLEAVKYLFTLTTEDAKSNMARSGIDQLLTKLSEGEFLEDENDIGCFVFFEMTDYRQELVFNAFSAIAHLLLLRSSQYELFLNLLEERMRSFTPLHFAVTHCMTFYTYHLEVVNDDDRRQLLIDVWRMIPTSFRSCRFLQDI